MDDVRTLIEMTGDGTRALAALLGYRSKNTLRQAATGLQSLPEDRMAWLAKYAAHKARQRAQTNAWLKRNRAEWQKEA